MNFKHYWYQFKGKILSAPIAFLIKYTLRILLWTCRFEITGWKTFIETAEKEKCLLALWHHDLGVITEFFHRFAPHLIYIGFISNSRDGEAMACLVLSYKEGRVIRVSHQAKHAALKEAIESLNQKTGIIVFTPDGPRGPRHKLKPGIVNAAKSTGAAILPFSWSSNRFWTLNTWDKFKLPKPFTTIRICFSNPLYIDKERPLDQAREELEQILMKQS